MAIQFTVELNDEDLPYFMEAVDRAAQRAAGKSAEEILGAAESTVAGAEGQSMPEFVRSRLDSVVNLIAMVRDVGWGLSEEDRNRVVSALTYFADPEDLIPDKIPVLGFLDDAIMIEVVNRVLQPEIEAYADFCAFRTQEADRRGADMSTLGREEWLEGRRAELQARMRARRGSYAPSSDFTARFRFS
jgi:uncharacterized membrane protein YkvA (DUF1232 family)